MAKEKKLLSTGVVKSSCLVLNIYL